MPNQNEFCHQAGCAVDELRTRNNHSQFLNFGGILSTLGIVEAPKTYAHLNRHNDLYLDTFTPQHVRACSAQLEGQQAELDAQLNTDNRYSRRVQFSGHTMGFFFLSYLSLPSALTAAAVRTRYDYLNTQTATECLALNEQLDDTKEAFDAFANTLEEARDKYDIDLEQLQRTCNTLITARENTPDSALEELPQISVNWDISAEDFAAYANSEAVQYAHGYAQALNMGLTPGSNAFAAQVRRGLEAATHQPAANDNTPTQQQEQETVLARA